MPCGVRPSHLARKPCQACPDGPRDSSCAEPSDPDTSKSRAGNAPFVFPTENVVRIFHCPSHTLERRNEIKKERGFGDFIANFLLNPSKRFKVHHLFLLAAFLLPRRVCSWRASAMTASRGSLYRTSYCSLNHLLVMPACASRACANGVDPLATSQCRRGHNGKNNSSSCMALIGLVSRRNPPGSGAQRSFRGSG